MHKINKTFFIYYRSVYWYQPGIKFDITVIIKYHSVGTAINGRRLLVSCRFDMEVLPPNLKEEEVTDMKDSEILSLVIGIIGLVLSAITVGFSIR